MLIFASSKLSTLAIAVDFWMINSAKSNSAKSIVIAKHNCPFIISWSVINAVWVGQSMTGGIIGDRGTAQGGVVIGLGGNWLTL